jgi:hypothetical protein
MDKEAAAAVLARQLQDYRGRSYESLRGLIGKVDAFEIPNPGGSPYQLEIEVRWDGRPGGDIRVLGGIDDGGWSAFAPLTDGFLMSRDGVILGEMKA